MINKYKMEKIFCPIVLLSFILLFSCTDKQDVYNDKNEQHFVVDISKESDPELLRQVMVNMDARLVSLETRDSILFKSSASDLFVTGDFLFVVDKSQKIILHYDLNGKFINKINRSGQGPKEYLYIRDVFISENRIYIRNNEMIQVYDFDGSYLKTIRSPKGGGDQFYVDRNEVITQIRSYLSDHQLMVYDKGGQLLSEYFSTPEVLLDFYLVQSNFRTIGHYNDGIYLSKYFDTNIYQLKDGDISILATFDFGNMNMPKSLFEGTGEEVCTRYSKIRENSTAILNFDNLIVTDDWIIFNPPLFTPEIVVYCNRKNGKYLINKDFYAPYAMILGKYYAPDGYDSQSGEFYRLVNAALLKGAIEELQQSDKHYLEKYPFLKGIDLENMDEESNDWVIFFKM